MAQYAAKIFVQKMIQKNIDVSQARIGLMGITFKDNCPDIRNSKVFDLITELQSWGVSPLIHDPWANPEEVSEEHGFDLLPSIDVRSCDAVVVAVAHQQFVEKSPSELISLCKDPKKAVLGDLKSVFGRVECEELGFDVFRL